MITLEPDAENLGWRTILLHYLLPWSDLERPGTFAWVHIIVTYSKKWQICRWRDRSVFGASHKFLFSLTVFNGPMVQHVFLVEHLWCLCFVESQIYFSSVCEFGLDQGRQSWSGEDCGNTTRAAYLQWPILQFNPEQTHTGTHGVSWLYICWEITWTSLITACSWDI